MLFVGKFINNFRDFYKEINSATLTGAIDVIIIRQPDGSYLSSPFHVRFGKIGVLRSREKVVDIEINGIPVDIHMKLGESGEAFFVVEAEDDELPPCLATSPLIGALNIEVGSNKHILENSSDKELAQDAKFGSGDFKSDQRILSSSPDINISDSDYKLISHKKDADAKELPSAGSNVPTDSSDEFRTRKKLRRKKTSSKKRPKNKEGTLTPSISSSQNLVIIKNTDAQSEKEEIFDMDDGDEGIGASTSPLSRSLSLPTNSNINKLLASEWNNRKTSSTFTGEFHPFFSDGDLSPQGTPKSETRPPSPKSDTEYEKNLIQDNITPSAEGPSWDWGQLPILFKESNSYELNEDDTSKSKSLHETTESQTRDKDDEEKRSMLGGMLSFMRSTKKIRHNIPEGEGIYLSELNVDELNPELAALYFPKFKKIKSEQDLLNEHSSKYIQEKVPKPEREKTFYLRDDVAISLCGGLVDFETQITDDQFYNKLITFEEFTDNPGILHDPNLVVRIKGKYYNWAVAEAILTSLVIFNIPLSEKVINSLVAKHMPKKKKTKSIYTSWWSWGKSDEVTYTSSPKKEVTNTTFKSESQSTNNKVPIEKDNTLEEINLPPMSQASELIEQDNTNIAFEITSEIIDKMKDGYSHSASLDGTNIIPQKSEPINIENTKKTKVQASSFSLGKPSIAHDNKTTAQIGSYRKSLRLTSEQIKALNLKDGPNEVVFSVTTAYQGTTRCSCTIFLWNYDDKIVISDIDGTITRSDVLGHILPMVGHPWAQLGVAKLYSKIKNNGYQFLYLSARAIGQAGNTREYLRSIRQGEICLPDGPLLLSPTSLMSAFHREIIRRNPEEFKIDCLKDILTLFPPHMGNPFYAGFGNKINDTWAYRAVGIPTARVFTINHRGELKIDIIQTFQSSYTRLSDQVDHVFPPLKSRSRPNGTFLPIFSSSEEFSYFTYWRDPLPILNDEDIEV